MFNETWNKLNPNNNLHKFDLYCDIRYSIDDIDMPDEFIDKMYEIECEWFDKYGIYRLAFCDELYNYINEQPDFESILNIDFEDFRRYLNL